MKTNELRIDEQRYEKCVNYVLHNLCNMFNLQYEEEVFADDTGKIRYANNLTYKPIAILEVSDKNAIINPTYIETKEHCVKVRYNYVLEIDSCEELPEKMTEELIYNGAMANYWVGRNNDRSSDYFIKYMRLLEEIFDDNKYQHELMKIRLDYYMKIKYNPVKIKL